MFGQPDSSNPQQDLPAPSLPDDQSDDTQSAGPPPAQTDDTNLAETPNPQADAPNAVALDTPAGAAAVPTPGADDLLNIKQQALQQLSPLVGHLEQTPEEEFRTTMMMIQAADDQSLIQKAYDAALKITDEKTKAQALLDIVNEINYFTQHKDEPAASPET